jgi:hypothetical protein
MFCASLCASLSGHSCLLNIGSHVYFQVGVLPGEESMEMSGKGRVFASGYRPGLATARAFGNWDSKAVGVTATPDFRCITLTPADQVLIIASDGVWEILGETEVVATCMSYAEERDAEMAAEVLVQVRTILLFDHAFCYPCFPCHMWFSSAGRRS